MDEQKEKNRMKRIQAITAEVASLLEVYNELIGKIDPTKEDEYGFVPGLNMINEAAALAEWSDKLKEDRCLRSVRRWI